jgi:hypothetical protein
MTTHTDSAGNRYLGNCIWSNHNPIFRQNFHLTGIVKTTDIAALRTAVQTLFTDLSYTARGNGSGVFWSVANSSSNPVSTHYEFPSGGPIVANGGPSANLTGLNGVSIGRSWAGTGTPAATVSIPIGELLSFPVGANLSSNVIIGASANHTAILEFNYKYLEAGYTYRFSYAGKIQNINTGFDYYNANSLTSAVVAGCSSTSAGATGANTILPLSLSHFIAGTSQAALATGRAQYPIVCANAQTPTAQWATDFYVFDSDADIGDPCIGRLPGLLLAQGSYTLLKPVRISTITTSSPWFLPVATFAGKTVLMQVHSTMV